MISNLIRVIETALPVLAALLLGMFCRRTGFLTRDGIDALKKTVVNLTLPFVLLNAFATAPYSGSALLQPLLIFVLCCAGLVLGWLLAKLLRLPGRLPAFVASGFEAGMLGYALFVLLFPQDSTSEFAILDLGQTLFVFTLYKGLLSGKDSRKALFRDILVSPIIWSICAGVLLGATGLYAAMTDWGVAGILDSLTSFLSAPTGMLILLSVGYDLVLREIRWKDTARYIILRLVAMVILLGILIAVNRLLLGGMIHEGAATLMFLLPPPYVLPIFANDPEQQTQISSALSALTLVTLLLFAVMTALLA